MAALFVRKDSVYKKMGLDCWDIERDARLFPGGMPVIAHPPCRAWGRLRAFAKPRPDEKELAIFAIEQIRKNGGVLEHPQGSLLWPEILPLPGRTDQFGGFTISINQSWFGHRAEKKTFLYICGISKKQMPPVPISFDLVTHVVAQFSKNKIKRPEISKAEREHTPLHLAKWLYDLAILCKAPVE